MSAPRPLKIVSAVALAGLVAAAARKLWRDYQAAA